MESMDRRAFLKRTAQVGGATALASGGIRALATTDPAEVGSWSAQIPLGIVGIHAALLHTGSVLFYELPHSKVGSLARLFDPETHALMNVDVPYSHNLLCSGMSILPDGTFFAAGGFPTMGGEPRMDGHGTTQTSFFHIGTSTWSAGPPMSFARWYPTQLEMPDGTILVLGGSSVPGTFVRQLESFDPARSAWSTLPSSASKWTGFYPRMALVRSGDALKAGKGDNTFLFNPSTNTWSFLGAMQGGDRKEGAIVLLPGQKRVLTSGGKSKSGVVTNTAEIIDMSVPTPQWTPIDPMHYRRINHNLVLLADGAVLAVGGGSANHPQGSPVFQSERYDPDTGRWMLMASQSAQRTYHSTALLSPDGKVISAGANSGKPEQTTVDIYRPPYLYKGTRPSISGAPVSIGYGDTFEITTPQASDITRVALIRPGAVTHQINPDQRYVELSFTVAGSSLSAKAPPSRTLAPPGYYMLFILNSAGVPAIAKFVHVS